MENKGLQNYFWKFEHAEGLCEVGAKSVEQKQQQINAFREMLEQLESEPDPLYDITTGDELCDPVRLQNQAPKFGVAHFELSGHKKAKSNGKG